MLEKKYLIYKKDTKELPIEFLTMRETTGITLYEDEIGWYYKWGWMHPSID